MTITPNKPLVAGNTNTNLLKIIALFFMIIDHLGVVFFRNITEMRILGRIAFPIYCYCIVVGACYTHNHWKYALRLLIVGIISQPLYNLALNHTWMEPNIFLTLLLGLLAIIAIKENWCFSSIWGPVLALFLAVLLRCNYGFRGVLLILLLYGARESRSAIAAVMIAFCLYWGAGDSSVTSFFGIPLGFLRLPYIGTLLTPFFKLQGLAIMALPFILINMPLKLKMPKWVGYALYPAHLAVLYLLKLLL